MNISESEFRQLKAEIDAEAKAQTARIEQERIHNHKALDRIWAKMRQSGNADGSVELEIPFTPAPANGNGSATFAMKDAIRKIIRSLNGAQLTQPLIYRELSQRHAPNIAHRNQLHVKGQIAGILGKLAESDPPELEVVDPGVGRNPRIYKATDNLK